jgi:hypothetical protein
VRARWTLPLLVLCTLGALGSLALHLTWWARRPAPPPELPAALELAVALAWVPAVLVFALRAKRRYGSPFAPALARGFFATLFDGTPPVLRRAALSSVAYAFLFLLARWVWQLRVPDSSPPAPADPEMTAVALAFYVLSAAVLAGVGRERPAGPRSL